MNDRLSQLRILCAAADTLHFKQAASRLGVAPQAVTRAVQAIERELGEPVFHRSTRSVQLTTYGERFCREARERLAALDGLFVRTPARAQVAIEGVVRLAAPVVLGRRLLLPVVSRLMREHPALCVDLRLSDQRDDVVDQRIDLGLRIGAPRDNRFVVRPLGEVHFHIVARPALIRRLGQPHTPEDLSRLPLTALLDRETGRAWPWFLAGGTSFVPASPRLLTDDGESEYEAVMAGLGVGQLPDFMVRQVLQAGTLVRLMPEREPEPWRMFAYRPQRGPVPARVRLVFDALVQAWNTPQG